MNDNEARAWASLLLIAAGVMLWLIIDQWAPTQVVIGPLHLGESTGAWCHGLARQSDEIIVAFCK